MADLRSDRALGLQPRWFTGQQWADGTATKESILEFREAMETYGHDNEESPEFQYALWHDE